MLINQKPFLWILELAKKIESNSTSPQLINWIQKLENACNQAIEELKIELKNLKK